MSSGEHEPDGDLMPLGRMVFGLSGEVMRSTVAFPPASTGFSGMLLVG